MPNHLTLEELALRQEMTSEEVLEFCFDYGVPVYHGRVDKTLFAAQLAANEKAEAVSAS